MSDFDDEDFSLGEDSEDDAFDAGEAEEENDEEDSAGASDESDLEELAPKPKKARVSPKKPTAKKTSPPKTTSSSSSVVRKTAGPKTAAANTTKGKSPATSAKKSPKPKLMKAEDAEAAVLDYMRKTNRPYNLLNVFENMHRAIAKPSLTNLLDNLVAKEELVSKMYGKAKIYYMNQNNLPVPSEEERLAIEEQIKTVTFECTASEQELKSAEATLSGITSQISDADLDAALKQLEEEAATLETKVETLDQLGQVPVSPGRKDALKRKFTKYRTAWVARKRIAMDGVNQIADGMEKKTKAVLDLVGVETDEEAGIKQLPTI